MNKTCQQNEVNDKNDDVNDDVMSVNVKKNAKTSESVIANVNASETVKKKVSSIWRNRTAKVYSLIHIVLSTLSSLDPLHSPVYVLLILSLCCYMCHK